MRKAAMAATFLAMPAMAGNISLQAPIACDLENDCFIQQFVDRDPTDGVQDFTCGSLTYDGHKGTDFAVPTLARMRDGVDVIAAADGVVKAVRDDMADTGFTPETAADVKGRECGNGVVLTHPNGWETQYCHLREGSVQVKPGQKITSGETLGLIGMSGRAQFPHVHFSVRRNGKIIDPFAPDTPICGPLGVTLWVSPPPVRAAGIIALGLSDRIPDYATIKEGSTLSPTRSSRTIAIFANLFGPREGDILTLSLTGPDGFELEQEITFPKNQAIAFRAVGQKRSIFFRWPAGHYTGTAYLKRDDQILDRETVDIELK